MLLQKRILEWSKTLPEWQRDLLRRLTVGPLDEPSQLEVLKILAGTHDAPQLVPLTFSDLPADAAEHGRVEVRAVRDLRNINCLAPGQHLRFEPGLNVVFGDNGSGKSGYGRLIRRVTRSGETEEILSDVFDAGSSSGAQTAVFDIAVDDAPRSISVNLATDPARVLSAIEAFDASRAGVSVTKPNVIEHVPRPLRLLRRLSNTQDMLIASLRERASQRRAATPALPVIAPETAAGEAVADLRADSDVNALMSVMRLSGADQDELNELEIAAAAVRADQAQQLEAAVRVRLSAGRSALSALIEADSELPLESCAELADARRRLADISTAERDLAIRAFSDQRFDATGQGPWREMFLAAERFAQASGVAFPDCNDDAACPLCQQGLDAAARQRLMNFSDFIRSDLRQKAIDLEAAIKQKLAAMPDLASVRTTVGAELRGAPEAVTKCATDALAVLDAREERARRGAGGEVHHPSDAGLALDALREYCSACAAEAERHAKLRDEGERQRIVARLAELKARVAFVKAEDSISKHVECLQALARIEEAIGRLNTQRISLKLRELQEIAITDRLRKAIEHELREFDPVAGKVEVSGRASKGETVVHLKFKEPCRAKVSNVLSEGEQRALALAFFLAEVAVSDGCSAIVLDDPVSSLDHKRRAYLAKRLVREAEHRQVIVFSHDMAFLYLLQEAAEECEIELHGQTLQRAFQRVGMVDDGLPSKVLGSAKQIKALRHRLKSKMLPLYKRQDPLYEQEADRWVADLRKAYDQLIEDTVLAGTVRRYSSHVRVRRLHEVQWTSQVATRIDRAMRKASPKAHHEALELHPAAHTPAELTAMLDELEALYGEMGGKTAAVTNGVVDSVDDKPVARAVRATS